MADKNKRLENTLDFYNEKMTKKAVGRLFQEYMEEGEKNYFIPEEEDEGAIEEDIPAAPAKRRKRESIDELDSEKSYRHKYSKSIYENRDGDDSAYIPHGGGYYDAGEQDYPDEYSEYMDDTDVDYNKNYSYDTVKLYSPRRKRGQEEKRLGGSRRSKMAEAYERHLAEEEDYDDSYDSSPSRFRVSFLTVFFLIVAIILAFVVILQKNRINVLNSELTHLSERLDALSAPAEQSSTAVTENAVVPTTVASVSTESTTEATSQETEVDNSNQTGSDEIPSTYVVKKGDNAWKISKKIYGTGDYNLEILETNGLDPNSDLIVGQTLKLPQH